MPNVEEDGLSLTAGGAIAKAPTSVKELISFRVEKGAKVSRPPNGVVTLARPPLPVPTNPGPDLIRGDFAKRSGVQGLEAIPDVTMVVVPDLWTLADKGGLSGTQANGLVKDVSDFCQRVGERMAIIDPPPTCRTSQQIGDWSDSVGIDNPFATIYWPWLEVDSMQAGETGTRLVPPSGHIAGVWSRSDGERGVHKAPANEGVAGVRRLAFDPSDREQGPLNEKGINCLRNFRGRGIKVYGARTAAKTDLSWKYVNVRRYFNYLQESILAGTQWVVFEPNDHALWARIRRTINGFLMTEWRKGALFGATPQDAFFVKCDADINTAATIDLGEVHCQVGVAPVKPAEFVIFSLTQLPSGTSVVAE